MGESDPDLVHQNFVTGWVTFSVGACSLCASLFILFLIYRFKRWNGYLMLISSLVTVQFLFDISHMLYISPTATNCRAIRFMTIISGLSVTVWTNIITFVAFYIVYYGRLVDIYGNYKYYLMLAIGIPAVFAICVLIENDFIETSDGGCFFATNTVGEEFFDVYYYGRLILIGSNSCVVLYITHLTKKIVQKELQEKAAAADQVQMTQFPSTRSSEDGVELSPTAVTAVADEAAVATSSSPTAAATAGGGGTEHPEQLPSEKTQAMIALVRRLKFYPLVQLICRSLGIWNEFDRGKFGGYPSELLSAIFSPAFGTGYFIVFLIVMPRAYEMMCDYISCRCMKEQNHPHDNSIINNMSENELDILIHEDDAKAFNNPNHRIICCKSFDFSCWHHHHDDEVDGETGIEGTNIETPVGEETKTGRNVIPVIETMINDETVNPVFEKSKIKKMDISSATDNNNSNSNMNIAKKAESPKPKPSNGK